MTNKQVIDILRIIRYRYENDEDGVEFRYAIDLAIKALEERPKGEWKDHRWCSNCGCGIPTDVYGTSITEEEAHFCVECGARMEAEND